MFTMLLFFRYLVTKKEQYIQFLDHGKLLWSYYQDWSYQFQTQ